MSNKSIPKSQVDFFNAGYKSIAQDKDKGKFRMQINAMFINAQKIKDSQGESFFRKIKKSKIF